MTDDDQIRFGEQIADSVESFLLALRAIAREGNGAQAVSLLLLEISQVLLAGARLGAQTDFTPREEFQPDVGPEADIDELRLRLAEMLEGVDAYSFVFDPYVPEGAQFPEVHKDIHKLRAAPALPRRLYITEHGPWISRSDDGGRHWHRLAAGHARAVTRPIALHPRDPDRLWLALLEDEPGSDGIPRVYRRLEALESRDGGASWVDRSAGLPEGRCSIYRDAMDSDRQAPVGIAFGTSRGDLFFTTEDGDAWERIAADLPAIRAIVAA